jgi:hypothetical protein
LFLGVIDVLQLMDEQVVHGFDVAGKESHRFLILLVLGNTIARRLRRTRRDVRFCPPSANRSVRVMFLTEAKTSCWETSGTLRASRPSFRPNPEIPQPG